MADNLSPADVLAMTALLARVVRGEDEKGEIDAQRKVLDARYAEAEKRRATARTAFAAFGFDLADKELWTKVHAAMGDDAWNQGFALGGRPVQASDASEEAGDDDEVSFGEENDTEAETEILTPLGDGMPTVRELVIAQLAEAGEGGTKAAAIRKFIESTYSHTLHEKTVGMTLYRLSKDGLARRDRRTWFSTKPTGEEENPGGETPGHGRA